MGANLLVIRIVLIQLIQFPQAVQFVLLLTETRIVNGQFIHLGLEGLILFFHFLQSLKVVG